MAPLTYSSYVNWDQFPNDTAGGGWGSGTQTLTPIQPSGSPLTHETGDFGVAPWDPQGSVYKATNPVGGFLPGGNVLSIMPTTWGNPSQRYGSYVAPNQVQAPAYNPSTGGWGPYEFHSNANTWNMMNQGSPPPGTLNNTSKFGTYGQLPGPASVGDTYKLGQLGDSVIKSVYGQPGGYSALQAYDASRKNTTMEASLNYTRQTYGIPGAAYNLNDVAPGSYEGPYATRQYDLGGYSHARVSGTDYPYDLGQNSDLAVDYQAGKISASAYFMGVTAANVKRDINKLEGYNLPDTPGFASDISSLNTAFMQNSVFSLYNASLGYRARSSLRGSFF